MTSQPTTNQQPTEQQLDEYEQLIQRTSPLGAATASPGMAAALLAEVRRLRDELATTGSERDCLAMAVLFARQWTPEAPMSLRDGLDEILAAMPSPAPAVPVVSSAAENGHQS